MWPFNSKKTRSLEEVNAELANLVSLKEIINPQLMPQVYFNISIDIEMLHVLQWFLKHKDVTTLGYSKESLKVYEDIVKKKLSEEQNPATPISGKEMK